jgi:hypothetical protein
MLGVYAPIVWATQFTFAPQLDGWRPSRVAKITICVALGLLFLIPTAGGGFK